MVSVADCSTSSLGGVRREAPMTLMPIQARVCVPLYSTPAIVLGKSTGLASSTANHHPIDCLQLQDLIYVQIK